MNYLWAFMILGGIIFSAFYGTLPEVTTAALESAKEAVTLCITMMGVMSFWVGIMRIAEKGGMTAALSARLKPLLKFLFPRIPDGHPAKQYIAANMIANVFGLGWAATPAGLKAMESLKQLEESRRKQNKRAVPKGTASSEMCTFLIINISSLQLIPINIIAYRSRYGSVNPVEIAGPAIVATVISTLTAVIFCKIADFVRK